VARGTVGKIQSFFAYQQKYKVQYFTGEVDKFKTIWCDCVPNLLKSVYFWLSYLEEIKVLPLFERRCNVDSQEP